MTHAIGEDETLEPAPRNSLVVGHDGSDGADYALETAIELADELRAPVLVVRAWSIATAPRPQGWKFGYVSSFEELAETVHDHLEKDVKTHIERLSTIDVECRAVHGSAAKTLIAVSRDARMLVVGTRGLGGLAGMLLGSVCDQCVAHAACPVLVVRQRQRP